MRGQDLGRGVAVGGSRRFEPTQKEARIVGEPKDHRTFGELHRGTKGRLGGSGETRREKKKKKKKNPLKRRLHQTDDHT